MSYYSIYFSPTGGTKKVMEILTEELPVENRVDLSVPHTDYSSFYFKPEDICLIGMPSYGGRVPAVALERLKQMQVDKTLAVLVVVFGNRAYDDTLLELKNEAAACGFQVYAAIAAVAEHSIMRQFGEGRPDQQDKAELKKYAETIKNLAEHKEKIKEFQVPGHTPYRKYDGVPMKPKADKTCTHCGICAEKCPVEAIPENAPESVDKDRCISCMRCISVCPQHARKLSKTILFAASQKMKKACSDRKQNELFL